MVVAGLYLPYGDWMFCIQKAEKEIWWGEQKSEINVLSRRELDFRNPSSPVCSVLLLNQIWHEPRKWSWAETCPKAHDISLCSSARLRMKIHISTVIIVNLTFLKQDATKMTSTWLFWILYYGRVAWSQKKKSDTKPSQKGLKQARFFPTFNHSWILIKAWSNHERELEHSEFKMDAKAP